MKLKPISDYSLYSFKVIIGAVILLVVAVIATPEMFMDKFRNDPD